MLLKFDPPIIAHRGASAYAPENTLAAFHKAVQLGIKWIEFDVMQAQCAEPIIFHDEYLDRTTNGHGNTCDYPYHYLQGLDAGAWFDMRFAGEKIPSLDMVIAFLKTNRVSANVEIKPLIEHEEAVVQRVLKSFTASGLLEEAGSTFLFSSFSFNVLHLLRRAAPHVYLGMLLDRWRKNWQAIAQKLNCASIHVNHTILTPKKTQQIKAMNKAVLCYTVNDPSRARELFSWGVDAIFSDVPDVILRNL